MPYLNEHAARLIDPEKFDPDSFRRENDKFGEGIHAIFGKLKGEDTMTLQAIRFDAGKYTAEEARKWLEEHDYKPLDFEEANEKAEKGLSYFVPLRKVIEAKREVWGTAAAEEPDSSGEIMDYQKSKPHFWAWSKRVQKASNGKSLGNVRDSHTSKAVGKVIKMLFDDTAKAIRVGAKVVDNEAWQKVIEGVFTGFSIGGQYGKRWEDPLNKGYVRYEAIPIELSLVDLPCIPGATFEMVKSDGSRVVFPLLSTEGDTMKEKLKKLLKQADLDEEKIQEIAEEIAAILEVNGEYVIPQTFAEHEQRRTANGWKHYNGGIDWALPNGTPVYAALDGTVSKIYTGDTGYGSAVLIEHGEGLQTLYAHLEYANVKTGDRVIHGQMIGRSDNTGLSTGPHLHFEVRRDGKPIDPEPLLEADAEPLQKAGRVRVVAAGGANLRSTPMRANNLVARLPAGFELCRAQMSETRSADNLVWIPVVCWIAKADEDGTAIVQ